VQINAMKIKKIIGTIILGLGAYALYRFLVGEETAQKDWWCQIPVVGTIACTVPNISTLFMAILFLAVGGLLTFG
jgi:hypothetical protein